MHAKTGTLTSEDELGVQKWCRIAEVRFLFWFTGFAKPRVEGPRTYKLGSRVHSFTSAARYEEPVGSKHDVVDMYGEELNHNECEHFVIISNSFSFTYFLVVQGVDESGAA